MPGHTTGGRRKPSPPPEPNSENVDLTTMVDSMIKSAKRRRDAKRTKLKNEYHNRKTETQEEITNIFSEFEQKSHRAHRVQLERLVALLKRKEDIEGRMSTSIKALERAYLARCAEFKAAIDGRIAELH
ncbi:hypothetical protein SLS57_000108 [Botryosphaeria dothidea]